MMFSLKKLSISATFLPSGASVSRISSNDMPFSAHGAKHTDRTCLNFLNYLRSKFFKFIKKSSSIFLSASTYVPTDLSVRQI